MAERECLNCGETKSSIKRQGIVLCGIMGGYECPELEYEFPHHQWADWSDAFLTRMGVKPEAFDRHRRTRAMSFEYIPCEELVQGHRISFDGDAEFGMKPGQCWLCGKHPELGGDEA